MRATWYGKGGDDLYAQGRTSTRLDCRCSSLPLGDVGGVREIPHLQPEGTSPTERDNRVNPSGCKRRAPVASPHKLSPRGSRRLASDPLHGQTSTVQKAPSAGAATNSDGMPHAENKETRGPSRNVLAGCSCFGPPHPPRILPASSPHPPRSSPHRPRSSPHPPRSSPHPPRILPGPPRILPASSPHPPRSSPHPPRILPGPPCILPASSPHPPRILPGPPRILPASSPHPPCILPAFSPVLPASSPHLPRSSPHPPRILPASSPHPPRILPGPPRILPASSPVLPASSPHPPRILPGPPRILPASSPVLPASSPILSDPLLSRGSAMVADGQP